MNTNKCFSITKAVRVGYKRLQLPRLESRQTRVTLCHVSNYTVTAQYCLLTSSIKGVIFLSHDLSQTVIPSFIIKGLIYTNTVVEN